MKLDQSSVNVGLTKSNDSESSNRKGLKKDSNIPSSDMNYRTQNECKYFAIETHVIFFGLKNLEFNKHVDVDKSLIELSGR